MLPALLTFNFSFKDTPILQLSQLTTYLYLFWTSSSLFTCIVPLSLLSQLFSTAHLLYMRTSCCQPLHFILLIKLFLSTCRPQPTDNVHLFVRLWVLFLPPSFSTLSTLLLHLPYNWPPPTCFLHVLYVVNYLSLSFHLSSTAFPVHLPSTTYWQHLYIPPTASFSQHWHNLLWVLFFPLPFQVSSPLWYYPTAFCSLTLNPFLGLYCTACCFLSYANFPASYSFGLPQFCLGTCPSSRPPPPPSSPPSTQVLQYSSPFPPPSWPSVAYRSVDDKQLFFLLKIK